MENKDSERILVFSFKGLRIIGDWWQKGSNL
jgi:hypothetical protein